MKKKRNYLESKKISLPKVGAQKEVKNPTEKPKWKKQVFEDERSKFRKIPHTELSAPPSYPRAEWTRKAPNADLATVRQSLTSFHAPEAISLS